MNRGIFPLAAVLGLVGLNGVPADASPLLPAIVETPHNAQAEDELRQARAAFGQRRFDEALKHFKAAGASDSTLPPARLLLARLFLASDQRSQGRQALEQAAAEAPTHPDVYLTFAQLALSEGRLAAALVHFDKVGALADSADRSADVKKALRLHCLIGRASVADIRRDWVSVKDQLAAALELDPNNSRARQTLARALYLLGQTERARQELEQASTTDPALEPAGVVLGWLACRSAGRGGQVVP